MTCTCMCHNCRPHDTYFIMNKSRAPTQIIELENTLNGSIFPQEEVIRISEYAKENSIWLHLDGARIWHVAAETGQTIKELCEPFDSVSLCFSKGLGEAL